MATVPQSHDSPLGIRQAIAKKRVEILRLVAKHGANNIRLFGSIARGDEVESSDVDFLVELMPGRSLLDQVGLQQDLQELLSRKVDVVLEGGLSPYLADRILAEAMPL